MKAEREVTGLTAGRAARVLLGLGFALLAAVWLLPELWSQWLGALLAASAAGVLGVYALTRKLQARARLSNGVAARGRIVERSVGEQVLIEIPGSAVEPWASDAAVVAVLALSSLWLGALLPLGHRAPLLVCVVSLLALSVRLFVAGTDRLRLEISSDAWAVEALEGGRMFRRHGGGALRPELTRDALILWCDDGRVGVLRAELEPEERVWLGARLGQLARSAPAASALSGP